VRAGVAGLLPRAFPIRFIDILSVCQALIGVFVAATSAFFVLSFKSALIYFTSFASGVITAISFIHGGFAVICGLAVSDQLDSFPEAVG
jgi:hypothetical membrane protein